MKLSDQFLKERGLVRSAEAREILGVSKQGFYKCRKEGLKVIKITAKSILVKLSDIEAFMEEKAGHTYIRENEALGDQLQLKTA